MVCPSAWLLCLEGMRTRARGPLGPSPSRFSEVLHGEHAGLHLCQRDAGETGVFSPTHRWRTSFLASAWAVVSGDDRHANWTSLWLRLDQRAPGAGREPRLGHASSPVTLAGINRHVCRCVQSVHRDSYSSSHVGSDKTLRGKNTHLGN